ncbi:MAG: magnesium transporter CorA family protein [Desulfovibrio sp.]|jgi:magnesium transporter|nr:magnesium transporter CorA family protein [Desulfovibrio sp.]
MISIHSLEGAAPAPFAAQAPDLALTGVLPKSLWIDLADPTPEECALVGGRFGIPLEHLQAALDLNERPRLEYSGGVLLIVLNIPMRADMKRHVPFGSCPLAVILAGEGETALTVCLKEGLAGDLLNGKIAGTGPKVARRLVLTLLLRVSVAFIGYLRQMDEHVDHIERTLQESMRNQELLRMLHLEKSLIYFLMALKGNQAVLEKLRGNFPWDAAPEELDLLDDALVENRQAVSMAEIYSQVTGSLGDAFGAIVSNNLNKVMKVLTGLTIVFMVPSIIGSLYGMNVPLPWQESPFAFVALCGVCLGVSCAVYWFLRKMRWM